MSTSTIRPESEDIRMALAARRYTNLPLPPYRFTPGVNPHPTTDPRGHSYRPPGVTEPPTPWIPPNEWRQCSSYLFGCDLYNHGYWWESHEAWEALWKVCDRSSLQACYLHGLIQVAACHLKFFIGRMNGARRLWGTSLGYLRQVLAELRHQRYMGLPLRNFGDQIDAYYHPRLTGSACILWHDPGTFPYLVLSPSADDER